MLFTHLLTRLQVQKVQELLDSQDWSALCNDFRLAEKVLRKDYDSSREIMERIGKVGDFVNETCYHVWPLFKEFRQTDQFMQGYKNVYGYDFTTKLKTIAEKSSSEAEAQITREKEDVEEANMSKEENCPPEEPQHEAALYCEKSCGPST